MEYTELQVTSNFSFLRGASHPEELVEHAAALGYKEIALTDRNSFAGLVRAHVEASRRGIRFIPGCRLDLMDGTSLLAYPTNRNAYARLSALLTQGNRRTEKGDCHLFREDVLQHAEGSWFAFIPPHQLNDQFAFDDSVLQKVRQFREAIGERFCLVARRSYSGLDAKLLFRVHELSRLSGAPMMATNDVHYHDLARRELQDVVTCIREKCTIANAGLRLHPNAERYLKSSGEMIRLFHSFPDAILKTQEITASCSFNLSQLKYQYPKEVAGDEACAQDALVRLVWEGAAGIFGEAIPEKIRKTAEYELEFIRSMNYAEYFLTVYDLVRFARSKGILCQGRGSAANSTVCYCLGITSVDPSKFDLLFERFLSSSRNEPPDIDVDFEHERREEVIQYIYEKYGRHRAGIVATVTQLHHKGAVRDVGKVMGLSVDTINKLASSSGHFEEVPQDEIIASLGLNLKDPLLRQTLILTRRYMGFPRQLGQHTGGFVITQEALSDLCPILNARMEGRTCIEWNKDDIEALGFLKIDVLGLGMLTCIRKAFDLARSHHGRQFTLANIPQDDPAVYDMISHADTIGVFQIESRAQQSMLPRLRPQCFYDLVIEVAIVRPGPIQGDMVHPYLRRRNGEEHIEYPSPELEAILKRTLGVPLFQEQAMKIAIVAAGFTGDEADQLRRSMATFKAKGKVSDFEKKLINGMIKNGYSQEFAQRVFRQLEGFGSYGFPESHAASFALLVYVSSWLKWYYPDVFACALLNSLPMGFYQPAQLVIDARKHGVQVREADVNHSAWDNTLEEKQGEHCALRLGFRHIKGMKESDVDRIIARRGSGYKRIDELRLAGVSDRVLERLADADAFRSLGIDRRGALWSVVTKDQPSALFKGRELPVELDEKVKLPEMPLSEHVVGDYASTSLSLKAHPVSFVRAELAGLKVTPAAELNALADGQKVRVAGLVLVRQRPGTASGICFITLEDETGCSNVVVFQKLFDRYRAAIIQSSLLMVEGKVQKEREVIHVVVQRCYNVSGLLKKLTTPEDDASPLPSVIHSDQSIKKSSNTPIEDARYGIQTRMFPEGRNFR